MSENDTRQPEGMLSASRRRELVARMVRKILRSNGEIDPPLELVAVRAERAGKLWKWIPDDRLEQMVDRARAQYGGPGLTVERVAEAWVTRNRKVTVTEEERERRRQAAKAKIEREAAPPDVAAEFFGGLSGQLRRQS